MRVVVGLGGNALLRRGESLTHETQRRNVARAAAALAVVARAHHLVVTHGNGPQVGLLSLLDDALPQIGNFTLDVLGAESAGMIGYLLAQELRNELPGHAVASILTQVEVDENDPAFRDPTKPIGPEYGIVEAETLASARGWAMARDGARYRRVVPSPRPLNVLELDVLRILVDAGTLVICAGGGGIPVALDSHGRVHGVEAVVDKDWSAALVAEGLEADALVLLTDVSCVVEGWGTVHARPIAETTPSALRSLVLDDGSMGPKVGAAADFVERTGGIAFIGSVDDVCAMLEGRAGTRVVPD